MNLKNLFTEDRAVSPVIGVILMVAITVILAAVIGAFVLGLGDQASASAPQASLEFSFEADTNVTITHAGGQDVDNSTISINVGGEPVYENGEVSGTTNVNDSTNGWTSPISTGESIEIEPNQTNVATSGETVRVIWQNPSGGSSNIIAERDWPN